MKNDPRIEKAQKLIDAAVEMHTRAIDKLLEAKLTLSAQPSTQSVVKRLFDCWHELWRRRYNADYVFAGARDGAQFKRLLKQMQGEEIAARMKRYLSDSDDWLVERKHPLNVFISTISRYTGVAGRALTNVADEFELSAPVGCSHHPPCTSDVQHTQRMKRDVRGEA
jgi:hypothetical protein